MLILLISNIHALCQEGQIDINNASKQDLQIIIWVGPKIAEYIIESRPFESVDDLINVKYIGDKKLNDIKEQGLACVNENTSVKNEVKKDNEINNTAQEENPEIINFEETSEQESYEEKEPIIFNAINLNPKDIKTKNNERKLSKNDYAIYGLVAFCILLAFLFITKKRKHKSEFEDEK
ncbi:hypothetical protein DRN69_02830 [Candidatus Pacearchaeota archaeon]|nr:MAG: hypothetical protein DRN69_02830 [Candidatus Pacearchaeota archaeon]